MRASWLIVAVLLGIILSVDAVDCSKHVETFTCGDIQVEDCLECDGKLQADQESGHCIHRELFLQFLGVDIVAAIIWFTFSGVASASGVGGGGLFMPLGVILLGFTAKSSSGLSQASIFGAASGGTLLSLYNTHPEDIWAIWRGRKILEHPTVYTRPLIDYSMLLFLAPMEVAGASIGALVQQTLPNWLYLSAAAIVLCMIAILTFFTYRTLREGELKELECTTSMEVELVFDGDGGDDNGEEEHRQVSIKELGEGDAELIAEQISLLESDSVQFPTQKIRQLLILWLGCSILVFLRGGNGFPSVIGLTCDKPAYAILMALQFIWLFCFALYAGLELVRERHSRETAGCVFRSGDVPWSGRTLLCYSSVTLLAGVVAGLIGIGGGVCLGPVLLNWGLNPRVSTATTVTMITITSSTVSLIYVINGLVPLGYALFYFAVSLLGSLIGKSQLDSFVKRHKRTSLLVLILAGIISLATIGVATNLVLGLSRQNYCLDEFKTLC